MFAKRIYVPSVGEIPVSAEVRRSFSCEGFSYASMPGVESYLASVPHDVTGFHELAKFDLPQELVACARVCLNIFPAEQDFTRPLVVRSELASTVRVGPEQAALLDLLIQNGLQANVLSGYRSPLYQALLFAAKYLNGCLFDSEGRYGCLPPGLSTHGRIDAALDIENSLELTFFLSSWSDALPCSLYRPFLTNRGIVREPWHWRTVFACQVKKTSHEKQNRFPRERTIERSSPVREYIDANYQRPQEVAVIRPTSHIFVYGYDDNGASSCVGSLGQTVALSIVDAAAANGQWPHQIVSVPHGFTPQMDGKLLPWDVGSCVIKLINESSDPTYLTPFSCIANRINTPERVYRALINKARLSTGETYSLEKSFADEWLCFDHKLVAPMEYGNPRSGFYRFEDAAFLIPLRFEEWLASTDRGDGPPYIISSDRSQPEYGLHLIHHALLLNYLNEFCANNPALGGLKASLTGRLSRRFIDGPRSHSDSVSLDVLSGAVFFVRAMVFVDIDLAFDIFRRWRPHFERQLSSSQGQRIRLFLGHLASLVRLLIEHSCKPLDLRLYIMDPRLALAWLEESPFYALAAAQIASLYCSYQDVDAHKVAVEIIAKVVGHPSGVGIGEFGSFEGLETFQSALPVEAVGELWQFVELESNERDAVISRLMNALGFVARCQFDEGMELVFPSGPSLVGAVAYSLIDHHSRLDYGVHAAQAARFIADKL